MRDTAPLMILIAGRYRSGTGDDPAKMADNVRAMEAHAFQSADLMVETAPVSQRSTRLRLSDRSTSSTR